MVLTVRGLPRVAAFVAVGSAEAALRHVGERRPSTELDQATQLARRLDDELSGRPNRNRAYVTIAELRRWADLQPEFVQDVVECLRAANDAVLCASLGVDPTDAAIRSTDLAVAVGVGRDAIDDLVRNARFR